MIILLVGLGHDHDLFPPWPSGRPSVDYRRFLIPLCVEGDGTRIDHFVSAFAVFYIHWFGLIVVYTALDDFAIYTPVLPSLQSRCRLHIFDAFMSFGGGSRLVHTMTELFYIFFPGCFYFDLIHYDDAMR